MALAGVLMLMVTASSARAGPVPAELLPRVSLTVGARGRVMSHQQQVQPWVRVALTWRMGPLSRAWARSRIEEPIDEPRLRGAPPEEE